MSDFKYAAINAAIAQAQDTPIEVLTYLVSGVLSGKYPVVDGSSVYKFSHQHRESYQQSANDYAVMVNSGKADYPVQRFCLFVGGLEAKYHVDHIEKAALVVFADMKVGFAPFLCAMDSRDKKVLATLFAPEDTVRQKKLSLDLMTVVRCLSSWMGVRNAECEDSPAPREARRRYKFLPSTRFRRVFIRPVRRGSQAERYEITGDHCPKHHVRGHMRYVSQDKPLFGNRNSPKCWGPMWIPEHFRGDEKNGQIIQEYVPQPPHP